MVRDLESRKWKISKFLSKAKVAYPAEQQPTYEQVAAYIDECEKLGKHITYPLAGEKWNQIECQTQGKNTGTGNLF